MKKYLQLQIENSLSLGWKKDDIIIISNFQWEYQEIIARVYELNKTCPTGSKLFGILKILPVNDIIWLHDLDAWQNVPFEVPEFKDLALCKYPTNRHAGGSIFVKDSAKDLIEDIINHIEINNYPREERAIFEILSLVEKRERITILNDTFNLGVNLFPKRFANASQPIKVIHFHPDKKSHWDVQKPALSERLTKLLNVF
jgi:hypothetical protein